MWLVKSWVKRFKVNQHKASTPCNHDILDIRTRLEFGGARKDWSISPDVNVLQVSALTVS